MPDDIERAADDRPLFPPMWPGYLAVKRKIAGITRFRDLIIYREQWAGADIDVAPIHQLIPGIKVGEQAPAQIVDREIKRAQRPVHNDVNFAQVPTRFNYRHRDFDSGKFVETPYEIILDYYRLPRNPNPKNSYDALINTLEEAIGTYQVALRRAKRDLYNPISWIAKLIRLPITIMERAGFGEHEKTQELMLGGYVRFVKIAMGVILAFAALILGVKVPWGEIVNGVIQYIFK